MSGLAPREASDPLRGVLITLTALVVLVRDWRMTGVTALLAGAVALVGAVTALRAGFYVPLGGILVTLLLAVVGRALVTRRRNIP